MNYPRPNYIEKHTMCGKHGHTELPSCVCREAKRLALEAVVRELLESVNFPEKVFDAKSHWLPVFFDKLENLRKAYKELSE